MLKHAVISLGLMVSLNAWAGPSSNVAWDLDTRNLVKSGDAAAGEKLTASCAGCHGQKGVSPSPAYPHTAGQLATYTFKQLKDYKDKTRGGSAIMSTMVAGLTDQNMADIAAFYAAQPLPEAAEGDAPMPLMVARGDGKRLIAACATCHGRNGEGKGVAVAALAGQNAAYTEATMKAYRDGARANDVYSVMRGISAPLTDAEIAELAAYYSQLK